MSKPTEIDVRNLPFWHLMYDQVQLIVTAGVTAPEGHARDRSAAMLAGVILEHLNIFAVTLGPDAERLFQLLLEVSKPDAYPKDDDSKLDPVDPSDPSAQWDNRRSVH